MTRDSGTACGQAIGRGSQVSLSEVGTWVRLTKKHLASLAKMVTFVWFKSENSIHRRKL